MIDRHSVAEILDSLNYFPVVGIIGPRQVGKTTLAKNLMNLISKDCIYLDLELPTDLAKLQEPELYLNGHIDKLVIIDEIQRTPELFPILRALIDQHRIPGRFLILGSAAPNLMEYASESLAGRLTYIELTPFSINEISQNYSLNMHWFRGGFPNALLAPNNKFSIDWTNSFIQSYIERDLPLMGLKIAPVFLRRYWTMLAHFHGGIWNASSFGKALGVSNHTVNRYLDFMEGAFLIRRLYPFFHNIKKRLVKSPKIYIRDSGVLHRLANIESFEHLQGNPLIGASWEGYVLEQIFSLKHSGLELSYYRTHAGAECDVVFLKSGLPIATVEIKYSSSPKMQKGYSECIKDLKTTNNYIITPKAETFSIRSDVLVCSFTDFIKQYLSEL